MNTDFPINEEWRPVTYPEYAERYAISDHGRVMSFHHKPEGEILKPCVGKYLHVSLSVNGALKMGYMHIMVARAFIGECPEGHQVNHIDTNKHNNHLSNLEYLTPQQNIQHAKNLGRILHGETHQNAKLTAAQVREIRQRYSRGEGTQYSLATDYNVSRSAVSDIVKFRGWRKESEANR